MQVGEFISKWQANVRPERSACQEHFLDLCALLGEPTPNSDPTGAVYAFEKGATKAVGGEGWADVWRKERFAWEYKKKGRDLDAAHRQLLLYAGALGNPPLLVVSDIERIVIRTNWTNAVSERHDILLPEMADPARLALLKSVFSDPERLRPGKTREVLTSEAAGEFAELARRLRARGHDAMAVAHFVNRLVFCLFADDVGLLPPGLFERMLASARNNPSRFQGYAQRLFSAMAERGGEVDFTPVQWFNGGLFDDAAALPLNTEDVASVQRAAALDWAEVDPSILGTLFERGLDPGKRSQLGAHYTSRELIERIIDPAVRRPLQAEWDATRTAIEVAMGKAATARVPATATRARNEAVGLLRVFLDRLRAYRVLDPACGSGNFLYLSLLALKDLEHRVMVEAEALGLQREFPQVGPEAVLGIELNPYAAELARVSVWIGHIQWARRHGLPAPSDPVLRKLDTIECRDAALADDGSPAPWPAADVIVGNPPFLGMKRQVQRLGKNYVRCLRAAYAGRIPAASDLVCYWFEKAREAVASGITKRAGLVATQNIKSEYNRVVLDRILAITPIYDAWSNELWPLEGASVRVALICFGNSGGAQCSLNGATVTHINSDLSAAEADLTKAKRLLENMGVAFSGTVKGGKLDVLGDLARQWLKEPANANGRPNADVLMPWVNASDVTGRCRGMWIVDFGNGQTESEASYYALPYAYAMTAVKPTKEKSTKYGARWWLLSEWCPGLRRALAPLGRYIATPTGSSHRVFVWLDARVQPDHQLVAIARDDDTTFGILHSRLHEAWTRQRASSIGVGDDPRYNPATAFETFPFPDRLAPNRPPTSFAGDARAEAIAVATRKLVETRDRWLNPPELVERVPEIVPGFPDRLVPKDAAAAVVLRRRTLTALYNQRGTPEGAWLDGLHQTLDAAVAAAYGWPADLPDAEVLARLLALNAERATTAVEPKPLNHPQP